MRNLLVVVICFLLSAVNAHMWLRNPISQGGVNFIGGTTGPCNGLQVGAGDVTTFEAQQSVTFQFRVNQHGPAPFAFSLLDDSNALLATIKSNIPNQVTAGPDGFDGVNVVVTIPNQICADCRIQLSGMGQTDGSGKWYNCARVKIVAQGQLTGPLPASVSPTSGPTSGGTEVTVTGTNFGASSGPINCKFDSREVTGTWISSTQVKCTSPPKNQAVDSTVEVAIGTGLFSSTGTIFTYTGPNIPPIVERIDPSQAVPGETITVYGKNFFSPNLQCKFGNQTVPGTYVSDTSLTCVVPAMSGSSALEVSVDGSPYSTSKTMFTEGAGLTGGQIAGVIIGVVLVLSFILIPIVLIVTKKWTLKSEPAPSNWAPLRGKV